MRKKIKSDDMNQLNELDKCNICVVTLPFQNIVGAIILSNFIDILEPLSNELFVITGKFPDRPNKRIHIIRIKSDEKKQLTLIRAIKYLFKQLKTAYSLIKISKNVDVVIFHIGTGIDVLPILTAKLLRKKTVKVATGLSSKVAKRDIRKLFGMGKIIIPRIFKIIEKINSGLLDRIIIYSENIIKEYDLERYKNKITIAHEHFLDFNKFKIIKRLDERDDLVGYIGRLSEEKGTLNFVNAIPEISKEKEIKFVVGGEGQLRSEIENYLNEKNLDDKVKLAGWIPHDELPDYLNELKLVVLPSYTEGLPNTILEAMACGTPVLATPVGAIPDVIKDGETGFIMENNSPECIAENIVRALAHPNINEITKNARALIEEKYNYQAAVDRYRIILSSTF